MKIDYSPPKVIRNVSSDSSLFAYGTNVLSRNEYGIVILAGGQGTRLGFNEPKSFFPLNALGKTIIQIHLEEICSYEEKYDTTIPVFIMVNPDDASIYRDKLKKSNYKLPKKIYIFKQTQKEVLDLENKEIIQNGNKLLAPAGHGTVFEDLRQLFPMMDELGVKKVLITGLDNILVKLVDIPIIGYSEKNGHKVIVKSLYIEDEDEKMGVFVQMNNKVGVVEYIYKEQIDSLRKTSPGDYRDGNLLWMYMDINTIKSLSTIKPQFHLALKKQPAMNNDILYYKQESFIFDYFGYIDDMKIVRVGREEYAPIKNREGESNPQDAIQHYLKVKKEI